MADADKADDKKKDPCNDQVTVAVSSMRETAKWLVTIFGALGAALIGTLSLADLGSLSGDARRWAIVGFAIAMIGILVIVGSAAAVLTPRETNLGDLYRPPLQKYFAARPALSGGFADVGSIAREYEEASLLRVTSTTAAYKMFYEHVPAGPDSPTYESKLLDIRAADKRLKLVEPAADQVLAAGSWEVIRRRFARIALPGILLGVLVAAIGAVTFAAQVTKPESDSTPAEAPEPSRAIVAIDRDVRDTYRSLVGPDCALKGFGAVVLDSTEDSWSVVVDDKDCSIASFDLPRRDGQLLAATNVCPSAPPDPTPPPTTQSRIC